MKCEKLKGRNKDMYSCPLGTQPYKIQAGDTLWLIARRNNTTLQAILTVNAGIDMNNLYIGQVICIPDKVDNDQRYTQCQPAGISVAEEILSNHMRLLWEQHVYWTRMVINSMVFDQPDKQLVTDRLLRNAKDFEAALTPFYGETVAAQFADLLTSHITIAAEFVQAAIDSDSAAAADAEKRWYENADQIADFLAEINPYWSAREWQSMLYDHLAMLKAEAVYFITKDYANSIAIFENIEQEALEMADMMTEGIVRQFPQNF